MYWTFLHPFAVVVLLVCWAGEKLETIDFSNMFIHTKNCERMPVLTSFMLNCVRINSDAFNDISDKMGSLQTLAMRGVFGIQTGCLSLPQVKVLCLELPTKAGVVKLDLPNLSKLQLKMACPEELCITAPALKSIAFNLEVPKCSAIKFEGLTHARATLWGIKFPFPFDNMCRRVAERTEIWYTLHEAGWGSKLAGSVEWGHWNYPRLSTMAGAVKLDLPSLTNFRLTHPTKEVSPDELCITAPALKLGES